MQTGGYRLTAVDGQYMVFGHMITKAQMLVSSSRTLIAVMLLTECRTCQQPAGISICGGLFMGKLAICNSSLRPLIVLYNIKTFSSH